jgi:hypothetical protein
MRVFSALVAVLCPVLVSAVPVAGNSTDAGPPSDDITIQKVTTSGSGCPKKTVSVSISDDRTVVTLGFDEFQTQTGRGFRDSDRDKTCIIRITLHYPNGFSFAVLDATFHGFAQLDSGVNGSFSSTFSFGDDNSRRCATNSTLRGGGQYQNGSVFTEHDTIPTAEVVRSACGKNEDLVIRTRINLNSNNSTANGILTDDDATFALTQQVHIGWNTTCK